MVNTPQSRVCRNFSFPADNCQKPARLRSEATIYMLIHRFPALESPEYRDGWRETSGNSSKLRKMAQFQATLVTHGGYPKSTCMPYFHSSGRQLSETDLITQLSDNLHANALLPCTGVPGVSKRVAENIWQLSKGAKPGPISGYFGKTW